jgi:hypothetical protein
LSFWSMRSSFRWNHRLRVKTTMRDTTVCEEQGTCQTVSEAESNRAGQHGRERSHVKHGRKKMKVRQEDVPDLRLPSERRVLLAGSLSKCSDYRGCECRPEPIEGRNIDLSTYFTVVNPVTVIAIEGRCRQTSIDMQRTEEKTNPSSRGRERR